MSNKMSQYRVATIEPWHIDEEEFRPERNEIAESLFSLANEYMGTRGNFEEGFGGETLCGCYIGGIYVKEKQAYPWKRKAFPDFTNSMVNTANWLEILVEVDGESLDLNTSQVSEYRRSLDMREGILSRKLVFTTKSGAATRLSWERFVSHDDSHIGAIRLTLQALGHSCPVKLTFALDGRKENRDHATSQTHTRTILQDAAEGFLLTNILTTGQYTMHRMQVEAPALPGLQREDRIADKRVASVLTFTPESGKEHVFDKIVSVWTSRDAGHPHGLIPKQEDQTDVDPAREKEVVAFLVGASRKNLALYERGYARARAAHAQKVSHLWDSCDVEIEGDPAAQQGIRYCNYQLLSTYRGQDSFLNIGPKGYSGECYNGRTFWDTESYCLPFYLFNNPDSVKKLLEYRYNGLEAARAQAKEFGYRGAIFPWTTLDGTEDTTVWEYWMGEIHINAIIGYAIFVYTHVTGDKSYLHTHGLELLIELARFWSSRAEFIPFRNGYAINRVMGPNEFAQGVNNDWYTNYMAKWLLEYTLQALGEVGIESPDHLSEALKRTGFQPAESRRWREVAEKLILNYDPERDVFVENDIFLSLNPLSREELDRDRDYPIERKWTIEKIHSRQISKQPDVLLAMFLLRDRFTTHEKSQNYRFYEQRCVHTSSLSPSIHSILACDVGRYNQAYDYYLWSSRLDLDNFNNNTEEGLHISSMSGTWLNIVCGFGGLTYTGPLLEFSPILPPGWSAYRFKFVYRDRTIQVGVNGSEVSLCLLAGEPLVVKLYGSQVGLTHELLTAPLSPAFLNRPQPRAILFDLDGVIVDTARLHFRAWKTIADQEGIAFDAHINERLKGVSRRQSMDIILERASRSYGEEEIGELMRAKNDIYVDSLQTLTGSDILPGIGAFLDELGGAGFKTAIVSASRNAGVILQRIGLEERFDEVITGDHTRKSKPDPEGMLLASRRLGIPPESCGVIEDAAAGLEAAVAAGMRSIGIGDKTQLHQADYTLPSTLYLNIERVRALY
jgi:alpha,alpha-trehalose phosphorylase